MVGPGNDAGGDRESGKRRGAAVSLGKDEWGDESAERMGEVGSVWSFAVWNLRFEI